MVITLMFRVITLMFRDGDIFWGNSVCTAVPPTNSPFLTQIHTRTRNTQSLSPHSVRGDFPPPCPWAPVECL